MAHVYIRMVPCMFALFTRAACTEAPWDVLLLVSGIMLKACNIYICIRTPLCTKPWIKTWGSTLG